jgi:uncharacterized Tic20 family protein
VVTHLCQLLDFVSGFGGLIVPLVLWLTQKDKVWDMEEHGKKIVNFQLSMMLYALISLPLIFLGIGILALIAIGLVGLAFPIINAVKTSNGEPIDYPFSIKFFT